MECSVTPLPLRIRWLRGAVQLFPIRPSSNLRGGPAGAESCPPASAESCPPVRAESCPPASAESCPPARAESCPPASAHPKADPARRLWSDGDGRGGQDRRA